MKENQLIKISLISIFLGLILIFIAQKNIKTEKIKIKDVSEKYSYVEITGKVADISVSKTGTTFLKIEDETGRIDAVIFKNSINYQENITIGKTIKIGGKPQKYKDKLEIIVNSID